MDAARSPDRIEALSSLHQLGDQACNFDEYPTISTKDSVNLASAYTRGAFMGGHL
jgi:hypothetical protein